MTGRFARLVLAAGLAAAGTVLPAATAGAAPASACSSSTGVLVVVDFRALGGNVQRGCDTTPTTGLDALHEAGFSTDGTVHDGPGFVCRIDGRPSSDPCVRTPPASAYWSYWHANAGQTSWSYSTRGAATYVPPDGSVDAWVFGATDVGGTSGGPCFSPADARAGRATACNSTPAAPKPTRSAASRAPKHSASAPRPTTARTGTSAAPTRPASASTPPTPATTPAPASSSAVASGSATSPVTPPAIVDASPAAGDRSDDGGGSALPVVLGLVLVLVIGGAAAWTMRRRRAEADGS